MNKLLRNTYICLFLIVSVLLSSHAFAAEKNFPGKLIKYEPLKTYSKSMTDKVLKNKEFGKFAAIAADSLNELGKAENAVKAYRVFYYTRGLNGKLIKVSGLLAVPQPGAGEYPLLSYQHGTILNRKECPSYLDDCFEAAMVVVVFAAHGYVVSMPDYIGQGSSLLMHPYLHAKTEASASLDMLKAAKELCKRLGIKLNSRLFLAGYSQGGHSTMALQNLIETGFRKEFPITGSAPMAGPYSMVMSWNSLVKKTNKFSSLITGRAVVAYERIYDLKGILKPPYDKKVPVLTDGNHSDFEIMLEMPQNTQSMFVKGFLEKVARGDHPFNNALKANNVYNWRPVSLTRLYSSRTDDAVPCEIMEFTYNYMKKQGANIEMKYAAEGGNHNTAMLPILLDSKKWFDSL